MCYNFKTSILSYTLGMVAAAISLLGKKFELGIFILFYTQMQLSEALIWKGIDTNNTSLNKGGTTYGKYFLATHNIGLGLGVILAALYNKIPMSVYLFLPLIVGIILFGVVCGIYTKSDSPDVTYPLDSSCRDRDCQNPKNRLSWPYPYSWYIVSFILSLVILFVYVTPLQNKLFLGISFSLLLAISAAFNPKTVGSVWCFSTAIFAPLIAIVNNFI